MSATARASRPLRASVVIPTYGRETRLAFALRALARQTVPEEEFEVIVVRPGGARGRLASAPEGLRVRFLEAPAASRPLQRNVALAAAEGEVIAFTDDDCRPQPQWLERLLAEADSMAIVQGRTIPDPEEAHLLRGLAHTVSIPELTPWYQSCNIAYPRILLERLGGFDERFVASGEDTDLALRAIDAGARPRFCAAAVVRHAVVPQRLDQAVGSAWRRWHTAPLVFREHPRHREHLVAGVFFNRAHAMLGVALIGLPIARRRPALAAAAWAPMALECLDKAALGPRGLTRQLVHLPSRLARELVLTAGITRGAVRHRTLVI